MTHLDIHPANEPGLYLWAFLILCMLALAAYFAVPTAATIDTPSTTESTPANISRAQYLAARGRRQSAWGEHSLLLVRNDGEHQVIVGMTKPECDALYAQLGVEIEARSGTPHAARWVTTCYKAG